MTTTDRLSRLEGRALAALLGTDRMMKRRSMNALQKLSPAIRPNALRGLSVLIVDDNADARAILGTCFEHLGCVVVTVESAVEALSICRLARPDIVLTDISMPHHDGYWLLRALRSLDEDQQKRTPVIAMTAYPASRDLPLTFSASFDGWVSKPINVRHLSAMVKRLTRKRRVA
jgi:CheY-like chemotaxis protein